MSAGYYRRSKCRSRDRAIELIVKAAGGSIRDAESILEGFIRTGKVTETDVSSLYQAVDPNTIIQYFNHVIDKEVKAGCLMTGGWIRMGVNPTVLVTSLLEHLRNMILDFIVQDPTLKTMLKHQREKIGDGRIVQWIDFFYDQLEYIKDYPMEYSLVMDLITIKLVESMRVRQESKKKKDDEPDKKVEKTEKAEAPAAKVVKSQALSTEDWAWINQIRSLTGATARASTPTRVTLAYKVKSEQGEVDRVFDVVVSADHAMSDLYFLCSDVEAAIKDYPNNLNTYVKAR